MRKPGWENLQQVSYSFESHYSLKGDNVLERDIVKTLQLT